MLSIQQLSSAKDAGRYYQGAVEYYQGDDNGMVWVGKGANYLNLNGFVEKEDFKLLLEGNLPTGQQLGRIRNGERQHRPGFDITFNAPKSFSILALMSDGDKRLLNIHDKAVEKTLALFEEEFAQTRIIKDGDVIYQKTGNLTIATLREYTSRENDPNLHTHSIVMNFTKTKDGKFRALASDLSRAQGTYENAWNYRNYFGAVYRSILAKELPELGYETIVTHEDGRFEIKGVPDELIQQFSKRRNQIEIWLNEKELEGAKASQQATLSTRGKKESFSLQALEKHWQEQATKFNYSSLSLKCQASLKKEKTLVEKLKIWLKPNVEIENQALDYAISHLSEHETVFKDADLRKHILAFDTGRIQAEAIPKLIEKAIKDNQLLRVPTPSGEMLWSTPNALETEKTIIANVQQGLDKLYPIANKQEIIRNIQSYQETAAHPLKKGQKNAIHTLLSSKHLIVGVQGYAGTGKTTMLRLVKSIAEKKGFSLIAIAPTAVAARKLGEETGLQTKTLSKALIDIQHDNLPKKVAYILDEASMASNEQLLQLTNYAKQNNIPLRLIGDKLQHSSISAGKPFSLMQVYGMATAEMKDILRQKNNELKAGVYHAIGKNIQEAIKTTKVIAIDSKAERLQAIAKTYLSLPEKELKQTLFIVPANKDREELHNIIRTELQKQGRLHGDTYGLETFISKGLTQAQMKRIGSYQVNDVLRFNRRYQTFGIEKDTYAKIIALNKSKQQLVLQTNDGHAIAWSLNKLVPKQGAVEVYKTYKRNICVGEKLRFRRNDKSLNIVNAEEATIAGMNDKNVVLKLEDNKEITLNKNHPALKHIDYAYTHTNFSVQGIDRENVIALIESQSTLTTQKAFYIDISRAKQNVTLITDNKDQLVEQLNLKTGEKTSIVQQMHYNDFKHELSLSKDLKHKTIEINLKKLGKHQLKRLSVAINQGLENSLMNSYQKYKLENNKENLTNTHHLDIEIKQKQPQKELG